MRGLLVEGGATAAAEFVAARLVDRVVAYPAPTLLDAGREVLAPVRVTDIGEAARLRIDSVAWSATTSDWRCACAVGAAVTLPEGCSLACLVPPGDQKAVTRTLPGAITCSSWPIWGSGTCRPAWRHRSGGSW
ncbi:dihydrofolate reductase family protein [Spirillospora sp. CA-253888]